MAENSKIEWTHHTANLWWGCTEVHAGCDNCYARVLANRWNFDIWGNDKPRRIINSVFNDLDKFQRNAAALNEVHRVFVGSMMDIAEKSFPLVDHLGKRVKNQRTHNLRFHLFYRIDRGDYPNLLFLFLTKRPSNINKIIFNSWMTDPPKNIMWGTSPVDQKTADTLIPQLLKVKGRHFLSVEPQLGHVDLSKYHGIDWVIQGGESGHHRRPFDLAWARSLRDQCKAADVPYFFKQIDKILPIPEDLQIREFPKTQTI